MPPHVQDEPLKPRPTIRVGVTGHRTKGLAEAGYNPEVLKGSVRQVLSRIREIARQICGQDSRAGGAPILRVVSPLAEGADRVVAQEGLALGYELESPLPFPRLEYEKDFQDEESKQDFRALLQRSTSVIELDGRRSQETRAYEAVGRWVLLHSDALIAIWNGKPAAGIGGTGQIVRESLSRGILTVWIQPSGEVCLITHTTSVPFKNYHCLEDRIQQILDSL
jgi:hypothetical protein